MIDVIAIALLIGCGYVLGYSHKQKNEYIRGFDEGYFLGHYNGVNEQKELQSKQASEQS